MDKLLWWQTPTDMLIYVTLSKYLNLIFIVCIVFVDMIITT